MPQQSTNGTGGSSGADMRQASRNVTLFVTDFGADPSGLNDSTLAFVQAQNALSGGGEIVVPPGVFRIRGGVVNLRPSMRIRGMGVRGTNMITPILSGSIIRFFGTPTDHLFKSTETGDFISGGVELLELDGEQDYRAAPSFDAINFDSVLGELHKFSVTDCYIHHFRRAYSGAVNATIGGDQSTIFSRNHIWFNTFGTYISQHPRSTEYNDFRYNLTAISGPNNAVAPYDINIIHNVFAFNKFCITPLTGNPAFNFMCIAHNIFTRNEVLDIEMGAQGYINDNRFAPPSPYPITTWTTSGGTTTATINLSGAGIRPDPGLKVGDMVYFCGTGETRLDKVTGLTVASIPSATQITVTVAAGGSNGAGGSLYTGRHFIHAAQAGFACNDNIFRNEAATEIKPDWMIYIDNAGQNLAGGMVNDNDCRMTQTPATLIAGQAWLKFLGINCTELRDFSCQSNSLASCGQFLDTVGATRLEQSIVLANTWTCNVAVPATESRLRIGATTFGNRIGFNEHRPDTNGGGVDGGQFVFDLALARSVATNNVIRAIGGGYSGRNLVNVSAVTLAGVGVQPTIGATAVGVSGFAAGPGALTDTAGFATLNYLSSTN